MLFFLLSWICKMHAWYIYWQFLTNSWQFYCLFLNHQITVWFLIREFFRNASVTDAQTRSGWWWRNLCSLTRLNCIFQFHAIVFFFRWRLNLLHRLCGMWLVCHSFCFFIFCTFWILCLDLYISYILASIFHLFGVFLKRNTFDFLFKIEFCLFPYFSFFPDFFLFVALFSPFAHFILPFHFRL